MEDLQIIALYWERSEQAIEETAQKFGRFCDKIAWNILRNREDAAECVNDTYQAAWSAIPPQRPQKLTAFLGRITRNLALDRCDRQKAQKRGGGLELLLSELEDCLPGTEQVENALENREIARVISQFLRSCSPEERRLFLRRYWYCDSIGELAAQDGLSESKVKSTLFRMRRRLRQCLESAEIAI